MYTTPLIWDMVNFNKDKLAVVRTLFYLSSLLMWGYIGSNGLGTKEEYGIIINLGILSVIFLSAIGMLFLFVWLVASPTWEGDDS